MQVVGSTSGKKKQRGYTDIGDWRGLRRWIELSMSLLPGKAARNRDLAAFQQGLKLWICVDFLLSFKHTDGCTVPHQS